MRKMFGILLAKEGRTGGAQHKIGELDVGMPDLTGDKDRKIDVMFV